MAYNTNFNPDALPPHAEPEQAAQALSALQESRKPAPKPAPNVRPSPNLNPAARRSNSPSNHHRPSPPLPQQQFKPSQGRPAQPQNPSYGQNSYQNPAIGAGSGYNNYNYNSPPKFAPTYSEGQPGTYQNYGQSPPSTDFHLNVSRPHPGIGPIRSPAPPPAADSADLLRFFRDANVSQSGVLSESELGAALVNADFTSFDRDTIKIILRMFSSAPGRNLVTYDEFLNLWRFLAEWRTLFERFDEDASGRVSLGEFNKALVAFGYRLSSSFSAILYTTYLEKGITADNVRRGSRPMEGMSFDLFVQACLSLKKMTDVFKSYDDDRDGYITLSFEEFLTEILKLRE